MMPFSGPLSESYMRDQAPVSWAEVIKERKRAKFVTQQEQIQYCGTIFSLTCSPMQTTDDAGHAPRDLN